MITLEDGALEFGALFLHLGLALRVCVAGVARLASRELTGVANSPTKMYERENDSFSDLHDINL